MQEEHLHEVAAARTSELPGAVLDHPFGPEIDVYKICGKLFMFLTWLGERPIITLKARPGDSEVLRRAYPDIIPGYHMNKKHWISVTAGGEVDAALLEDLVTESYLLVVEGLPRAQRPVNPDTFGQAAAGE